MEPREAFLDIQNLYYKKIKPLIENENYKKARYELLGIHALWVTVKYNVILKDYNHAQEFMLSVKLLEDSFENGMDSKIHARFVEVELAQLGLAIKSENLINIVKA